MSIPLCPSTTTQQPCGQLSLRVVQSAVQHNTFSQLWGVRTPEEAKATIDEYFDYKFGRLDWRTVTFKTRIENVPNYQGNAVINYTLHDVPFTRVIEHKHFEAFGQAIYDTPKTVAREEYSIEYKSGMKQFYPVNDAATMPLLTNIAPSPPKNKTSASFISSKLDLDIGSADICLWCPVRATSDSAIDYVSLRSVSFAPFVFNC